jgi:hypothetical protein
MVVSDENPCHLGSILMSANASEALIRGLCDTEHSENGIYPTAGVLAYRPRERECDPLRSQDRGAK